MTDNQIIVMLLLFGVLHAASLYRFKWERGA